MKIAIMTQGSYSSEKSYIEEEKMLKNILKENYDVEANIFDWEKTDFTSLKDYNGILISSTWNLHKKLSKFEAWLHSCEKDGIKRLINDKEIILDGICKEKYLTRLINEFGIIDCKEGSIVPTVFYHEKDQKADLKEILAESKIMYPEIWSGDLVIKPITSADGDNTYRFTGDKTVASADKKKIKALSEADKFIKDIIKDKNSNGIMIQPFVDSIEKKGEYQLIFINGSYSHAIKKGTGFKNSNSGLKKFLREDELPSSMLEFAKSIIAFLGKTYKNCVIVKARIDFFEGEKGPILSEAELVEPFLNIKYIPKEKKEEVLGNYAFAITERVTKYVNSSK